MDILSYLVSLRYSKKYETAASARGMSGMPRKAKTRGKRFLTTEPLHRYAYQPVRIVGHEQRDIQEVAVQLQIFQREPHPQLYLLLEQLLEFAEAFAADVGFRLDLDGEYIVFPLNQEIYLVRRINLAPVARRRLKLCFARRPLARANVKYFILSSSIFSVSKIQEPASSGPNHQICLFSSVPYPGQHIKYEQYDSVCCRPYSHPETYLSLSSSY